MAISSPAQDCPPHLFSRDRAAGTLALMLGVGSHAINGFVTTAVLPDIIRDLGGQDRAFWVFSSFEMMAILAGCLTGAVKVRFGARLPFLLATSLLAFGSTLAGLSGSLEGLIAGRAFQGFGEGMIIALCYGLIPVLFPNHVAPRVFALLSGVWALAAGIGPVSAGLLSELWSWRAAFLVNIPLVLLLFVLMNTALPAGSAVARSGHKAEQSTGSNRIALRLLLLITSIYLLTVIGEAQTPVRLALTILAGLLAATILLKIDANSIRRLFPRQAFRLETLIGLGTWIVFLTSVVAAVRAIFVTTFGQVYWDMSVTEASYVAAGLAFSWTAFSWVSARAPSRKRELTYLVTGPVLIAIGMAMTGYSLETRSLILFALAAIVAGAGHGLSSQILMRSLMYTAKGQEQNLVSSILPTISSAGIAIGGGLTGLIAIQTGLITPGAETLLTKAAIAQSGASVFYTNAFLMLVPASAMMILRRRLILVESRDVKADRA